MAVRILGELGADLEQLRTRVTQELESQPEDSGYSPPLRLRRRSPQLSEPVQGLLDTIDDRLSAIERHLGIARPGEQAAQPDAGNGGSGDAESDGSGDAENGGSGDAENGGSGEAGAAAG